MLESLHFTYNGKSSKDYGVFIGTVGGGLFRENFSPNRTIVETTAVGNPIPFLQRVDEGISTFTFQIVVVDLKMRNQLRSIARWLYLDEYKPLVFESNPDIQIDAMFTGKSEFIHNGVYDGYITLTVKPRTPYLQSIPHKLTWKSTNTPSSFEFYNNGDKPLRFRMNIKKTISNGDVIIRNEDYNEELKINTLFKDEEVLVDCRWEFLKSSLEERLIRYLGDAHNDVWLEIEPEDEVKLTFIGNFEIEMEYRYTYYFYDKENYDGNKEFGQCNL
jgi:phage-related protein